MAPAPQISFPPANYTKPITNASSASRHTSFKEKNVSKIIQDASDLTPPTHKIASNVVLGKDSKMGNAKVSLIAKYFLEYAHSAQITIG